MRWLVLAILMLAGAAQANEGCGRLDWCDELVVFYANGVPPLPQDAVQAQALRQDYLQLAIAACQAGDPEACRSGLSLTQSVQADDAQPRLFAAADRLCDHDTPAACTAGLGLRLRVGLAPIVAAATATARHRHEAACLAGSDADCRDLRRKLGFGLTGMACAEPDLFLRMVVACIGQSDSTCPAVFADIRTAPALVAGVALDRLRQSCDTGESGSCYALARLDGSRPRRDWYLAACDAGHPGGCSELGHLFYVQFTTGKGDVVPAADAWARGCDLGHVPSCHYLKHLSRQ